jgi:Helicase associated domain
MNKQAFYSAAGSVAVSAARQFRLLQFPARLPCQKVGSEKSKERWERGFRALAKFRAREGHCCPSRHHIEGNFRLGDWVSVQRYSKTLCPLNVNDAWK